MTCATTNALRTLRFVRVTVPVPVSFRVLLGSTRLVWSIVAKPRKTPTANAASMVKARTLPSTRMPSHPGTHFVQPTGMLVRNARTLANEAAMATKPAAKEYKSVSDRKSCPRRPRLAPRAARKAISLWRPIMRAKTRFARFAQASSSTNPAAACSKRKSDSVNM